MKITEQIKDALAHYRCPACGKVEPGFLYRELLVCTFKFNRKGRTFSQWPLHFTNTLEDEGYCVPGDFEDVDDFTTHPVRCFHCDEPVCKPDGSVLTVYDFEEWLEHLGQRWEAQVRERAVLKEELNRLSDTLPPLGTIPPLEAKIKALELIS
jgi:hypothetical protein